jgi:hypothetical protein
MSDLLDLVVQAMWALGSKLTREQVEQLLWDFRKLVSDLPDIVTALENLADHIQGENKSSRKELQELLVATQQIVEAWDRYNSILNPHLGIAIEVVLKPSGSKDRIAGDFGEAVAIVNVIANILELRDGADVSEIRSRLPVIPKFPRCAS